MAKKSKKEKKAEEVVEETIHIEEEEMPDKADQKDWQEEFVVASGEMLEFIKNLMQEATIRRIVIKNERHDIHWEVPLVFGVAGLLALPAMVTMIGVVTALVTECSIIVERVEPEEHAEAEAKPA